MARESFLTTLFVDLDPADVSVALFANDRGETSVVLQLGMNLTLYVYDEAMLVRLSVVAERGPDLLLQAVAEPQLALADAEAGA